MKTPLFHLAFPVNNLEATRKFYVEILGCETGREDTRWIDFNFYGHQVVAHLSDEMPHIENNHVDGKEVPASHFGVILSWDDWHELAERLKQRHVQFLIEPYIRFKGLAGEQATLFILDPSGNGLEFKAFKDQKDIFAKELGH